MDEGMRNKVMIGVVVVALGVAGVIAARSLGGNSGGATLKGDLWLKCSNESCQAEYEISKKEYAEIVRNIQSPGMMMPGAAMAVPCQECGQETAYRAFKCEKCGTIAYMGGVPNDFMDRCPECGYSATEEQRKQSKE